MFGHGIIAALMVLGVAVTICQSGPTTITPGQAGRMVSGKPGQAGRGVGEKPAGRSALGALEKESPLTAEVKSFFLDKKLLAKIIEDIHKKMNSPSKKPLKIDLLTFASQMVAGTNYFVKAKVTVIETNAVTFWTIKVHQGPDKMVKFVGVQGPHKEADPIAPFDDSKAGRGIAEKPAGRSALGGLEKEMPLNAEVKTFFLDEKVVLKIVEDINKKMKSPSKKLLKLEPLTYASQMVAGTNYFVKTRVTCIESKAVTFWTIKIHHTPDKMVEVLGVQGPHKEADPIAHFDDSTAGGKPGQAGRGVVEKPAGRGVSEAQAGRAVAMKAAQTSASAQGQLSKEMPADATVKGFFADKKVIAQMEELIIKESSGSVKKPIKLEPLTFVHFTEDGGTSYLVKARVTCVATKVVEFRTIAIHHSAAKKTDAVVVSGPHDESARLEI